jgi:ferric-dicitrate binding protein FerR (iron transport regulator)
MTDPADTDRPRQARRDLDHLARGQGAFDTHLPQSLGSPPVIDESDPAEVWGRRVGRGLAVVAGGAALIWLFETYIRA